MCTRTAARGRCRSALRSKSSNDMQRSARPQSTKTGSPPAWMIARGVAMNVFEGHRTFAPRTRAKSRAASAAPLQPAVATDPRPCSADQAASNRAVISPSDQRSEITISSQRSCSLGRSRRSKPIANWLWWAVVRGSVAAGAASRHLEVTPKPIQSSGLMGPLKSEDVSRLLPGVGPQGLELALHLLEEGDLGIELVQLVDVLTPE